MALLLLAVDFFDGLAPFVALAFLMFAARFFGGFLMVPVSIRFIVLSSRLAALAICLVVDPRFLAADIAFLAAPPVFLPATPFFGDFAIFLSSFK